VTHYSDLDLQGFVSRALLAILQGKVPEAERSTLRDSKQYPYHEADPDLLLLETRFGDVFNLSQRFVLYGEKRQKALWRMSVDTWWDERGIHKLGLELKDVFAFYDESRMQGHRLNRVVGFKNRELLLREKPNLSLHFDDNALDPKFSRFIGDLSVKVRFEGLKEQEIGEAYFQGGRL
jgi:hypothetical protein